MKKYRNIFYNINDDDLKRLKINDSNYKYNKTNNKYINLNYNLKNIRLYNK